MNRGIAPLMLVIGTLALASCTPTLNIRLVTIPEGAGVYSEGKYWGRSPVSLEYEYDDTSVDEDNLLLLPPITLKWISGATLIDTPDVDLNQFRRGVRITYERPDSIPNAAIDAEFGAQSETNRILREGLNAVINEQQNLKRAVEKD